MKNLRININGIEYNKEIEEDMSLLYFIRNVIGLKGTKEGCGEGECGACTVLVEGVAVDSCLMFALQCEGKSILTIEGLSKDGKLDPLQTSFIKGGAVQCGFCTPGMIMSAKALLDKNPSPTEGDISEAISGNLCRCTGYTKILSSIEEAASIYASEETSEEVKNHVYR